VTVRRDVDLELFGWPAGREPLEPGQRFPDLTPAAIVRLAGTEAGDVERVGRGEVMDAFDAAEIERDVEDLRLVVVVDRVPARVEALDLVAADGVSG